MKMKLPLLVGLASLAALVGVQAQSAVTDPVGYITIDVAGTPSGNTFSAITPTLVNKTEFAGVVSSVSGDGLTLTVSSLTAGAFGPSFWLEVTNGAGEGAWTNIVSNTATTITVADSMTAFLAAGTSTITIRKHVTINDFFGATNSAGLQGGGDPGQADEVTFLGDRGVASGNVTVFYDPNGPAGWFDGDFAPAGNKIIEPGQGLLIARKATSAQSFVQTGYVKKGKSMTSVLAGPTALDFGENVVGVRSAVGVSLATSALYTGVNATGVRAGDDPGLADEVIQFVNGAPVLYFNDGTGWLNGDFGSANAVVLKEGTALYIVRKGGGDFVWTSPAVTIAN